MRPNPQEVADLVTFTEEILNGKLHFLSSDGITNDKYEKAFTISQPLFATPFSFKKTSYLTIKEHEIKSAFQNQQKY